MPVLASYDSIGSQCMIERFECGGTGSEELMAICEANYREGMEAEELGLGKRYVLWLGSCGLHRQQRWHIHNLPQN